ncbi:MAG: hypothetical protein IT342_11775 [Candidatus Melainabacteria bacterium]|nr:hypothetical protein [Candidatus Melainabacteria bacterium]
MKISRSAQITIAAIAILVAVIGFATFQAIDVSGQDTKSEIERYSTVQRRIADSLCPKCNGQFENGFLVDRGHSGNYINSWVQGTPKGDGNGVNTDPGSPVVTMRCKACGFLESYAR